MAPSPDPRPTAPASDEALAAPRRGYAGFSWAKLNETVVSILLVGLITGLMLFNFNETSDRMTRLEDDIDTNFAELRDDIDTKFAAVDARFAKLEDDIDTRFAKLEDDIDTKFAAVDARFAKLEANQQEIALTLARLVALLEARDEALTTPEG